VNIKPLYKISYDKSQAIFWLVHMFKELFLLSECRSIVYPHCCLTESLQFRGAAAGNTSFGGADFVVACLCVVALSREEGCPFKFIFWGVGGNCSVRCASNCII